MPIERDNVSTRIIGNNVHGLQFYDDDRTLRHEIYLDGSNELHISSSVVSSTEIVSATSRVGDGQFDHLQVNGVLEFSVAGGLWQGDGTFDAPTTGLKIWNHSGQGKISGYNAGVPQWYADTDGMLYAGAGRVKLSGDGLDITMQAASETYGQVRFNFAGAATDLIGKVYGNWDSTDPYAEAYVWLYCRHEADDPWTLPSVMIMAYDAATSDQAAVHVRTLSYPHVRLYPEATVDAALYVGGEESAPLKEPALTIGIVINQGANDNEAFVLQSSDVGHPFTDLTVATTYATLRKSEATSGGLAVRGFKDADGVAGGAVAIVGYLGEAADTTKSTAARGVVELTARVTDAGTGYTSVGADGNLVVIRNNATARFIFDGEGSAHGDVEWIAFDAHDDVALLADLQASFGAFVEERRDVLERLGIAHYDDQPGHAMVNWTRLAMLTTGALCQVGKRLDELEAKWTSVQKMLSA